jgi:hypothetical protein
MHQAYFTTSLHINMYDIGKKLIEAELLVDAALAGHAHHHLSAGAGRAGHFHLSLLNMFRFHQDSTDRLPKCNTKKLKK